ncbi:MAG: hypothetical protein Q7W02_06765 [Candidatus Rokubacteria bacterium]|nr:hypothetical protein [Candidatus Rokubacteria bacterium]
MVNSTQSFRALLVLLFLSALIVAAGASAVQTSPLTSLTDLNATRPASREPRTFEDYVEIVLSAIVIVVFAVDRFSAPPSDPKAGVVPYRISRSTTTAAAYYTAVSLYGAIALGVFGFLLLSPPVLNRLVGMAPEIGSSVPSWARESPTLLVALILTVLLPKIPILSSIDEWFRTKLQRMAAIPHEVRRLSAEVRQAPFRVEPKRQKELVDAMVDKGFEPTDVRFEEGSAPHYLWAKLSLLMRELEDWEADARFTSYVLTYPNEFNTLRQHYAVLLPRARRCFSLLRELATDPESAKRGGAVYAYRDDFVQEVEGLLKDVYEAVSNAVLLCELTQRARVSQLIKLGFGLDPRPPRRLTLNELMGLFTGLSVVYAFGFVVMRRIDHPWEQLDPRLLVRAIMIAAVYCVAVWCAIYPKNQWSAARRHSETGRPWAWYLLSGAAAATAGALISFTYQLAMRQGNLTGAWEAYRQVSPWGIMTFATAYTLALLADDAPRDGFMKLLTPARLRWAEGLGLTVVLVVAAWLVHGLLISTHESALQTLKATQVLDVRSLLESELFTVLIGFAIGFLVPSWYRGAPVEPQPEGRLPAVAGAGGGRE